MLNQYIPGMSKILRQTSRVSFRHQNKEKVRINYTRMSSTLIFRNTAQQRFEINL